jgi:hypothetical protein
MKVQNVKHPDCGANVTTYFLKLFLAHILVRFALQPHLKWSTSRHPVAYLLVAGGLKALTAAAFLSSEIHASMVITLSGFGLLSVAIDLLEQRSRRMPWQSFLTAQFAYLVACFSMSLWWTAAGDRTAMAHWIVDATSDQRLLWCICIYLTAILGGNELTTRVADHFSAQFDKDLADQKPGLKDAGKYIGWLERILIVTFVVADFGEAVGFLLAAKALVRYPEIQADKKGLFGEYFLVGSLTSVGVALLAGVTLRIALTRLNGP